MTTQNPAQNINNWLDFLHQQGKSQHTLDAYRRASTTLWIGASDAMGSLSTRRKSSPEM